MLGQAVVHEAKQAGLSVVEVSRTADVGWDFLKTSFETLASNLDLSQSDLVVNCIGWIPQKSSGNAKQDEAFARVLNVDLVRELQEVQKKRGFRWLQILTDCVFSGKTGGYSEKSPFDPIDIYGISKVEGERFMKGAIGIRCSIIGADNNKFSGLFEWLRRQDLGARVMGYTNHRWNGVSTLAFGRLTAGLAKSSVKGSVKLHWIPRDTTTKFELLEIFKRELDRHDLEILPVIQERSVDRVLSTDSPEKNVQLWQLAGYDEAPSIEELTREFITYDKTR